MYLQHIVSTLNNFSGTNIWAFPTLKPKAKSVNFLWSWDNLILVKGIATKMLFFSFNRRGTVKYFINDGELWRIFWGLKFRPEAKQTLFSVWSNMKWSWNWAVVVDNRGETEDLWQVCFCFFLQTFFTQSLFSGVWKRKFY